MFRNTCAWSFVLVTGMALAGSARGQTTWYPDEADWLSATTGLTLIDFDDLSPVPVTLSTQYSGVVFSSSISGQPQAADPLGHVPPGFTPPSLPNVMRINDNFSAGGGDWKAELDPPPTGFGFWVGDPQCVAYPLTTATVQLQSGSVIQKNICELHPSSSGFDWRFVGVTAVDGIASIEIDVDDSDMVMFDNLMMGTNAMVPTEMEWVTVCAPGNVDDIHGDGYGGVDYIFRIGKYEVTNAQYCEFLNAVAADDLNGLYNPNMSLGVGGITRSGPSGSHTYGLKAGRSDMPVFEVSWYDALRFANWMHNGQPTGAQDASTTEDGAYYMSLGDNVVRKCGARVFLSSEDEWYKAAYYEGGATNAGYWDYPTQSDAPPTAEAPPGTDLANGSANYGGALGGDFTRVGSYTAKPSDSAYGTFDQGGNVWEWHEGRMGPDRGVRGGSSTDTHSNLHAQARAFFDPMVDFGDIGFRVAASCEFTDADGDGDIDLADFAVYQTCFCGPVE